MTDYWDKITNSGIKGISTIGISDIIGNGISAGFWFYLASLMTAENYGQISYFIAIGGIATTISLIGSTNTLTVHTAKNLKTESTLYITSLIITAISAIVVAIILCVIGFLIAALFKSDKTPKVQGIDYKVKSFE